jgi:TonB family protein
MNGAMRPMTTPVSSRRTSLAWLLTLALTASSAAQENVERIDSETDRKPLQTMVPDYPEKARRERIEGEVQVCFDISRRGYPRRVAVRRSTHPIFERPALKAVRQSTWRPVEGGKELSGIKSCRTFRFSLVPVGKKADQS